MIFFPRNLAELSLLFREIADEKGIFFLGAGSNLLVRDNGISEPIISTKFLRRLEQFDYGSFYAESGILLEELIQKLASAGFCKGISSLFGIPGTLGGALAMNAGAYGETIWNFVESVDKMNRRGEIRSFGRDEFEIGYRSVKIHPEWEDFQFFCAAQLRLFPERQEDSEVEMTRISDMRRSKIPIQPSAGSIFKNPTGESAANLISQVCRPFLRVNGAFLSHHLNCIINPNLTATATDVEELIDTINQLILEKFGQHLELEVKIVGELQE